MGGARWPGMQLAHRLYPKCTYPGFTGVSALCRPTRRCIFSRAGRFEKVAPRWLCLAQVRVSCRAFTNRPCAQLHAARQHDVRRAEGLTKIAVRITPECGSDSAQRHRLCGTVARRGPAALGTKLGTSLLARGPAKAFFVWGAQLREPLPVWG